MERDSALSTAEIVGVAAASAAALGGVIVALGRSQAAAVRQQLLAAEEAQSRRLNRESVERGRELARSAAASLVASYPELRVGASELLQRAAETARPHAMRASDNASLTAEQLRTTGAQVLERIQGDVLPAASTAIAGLVERAEGVRHRPAPVENHATPGIRAVAAQKADVALTKSTSAAKDSLATVAWTAAALAVIYFVLLSPERRDQIKNFLWGAFDQALVLVRDFQGYDDEF